MYFEMEKNLKLLNLVYIKKISRCGIITTKETTVPQKPIDLERRLSYASGRITLHIGVALEA